MGLLVWHHRDGPSQRGHAFYSRHQRSLRRHWFPSGCHGGLGNRGDSYVHRREPGKIIHKVKLRELLPTREELRASWGPIFRGTSLGFVIGLLPGSAHVLSSFVSYTVEKRLAKRPEEFGTGRIEGVAGPETANNAATESAMIPFLSLGIPTGHAPAVMMIALLIHGVRPGPLFISEQPQIFWGLVASMYIGNVILIILNLPLVGIFVNLLRVPFSHPVSDHLIDLSGGNLFRKHEHIRIGTPSGFSGFWLTSFRKLEYDVSPFVLAMIIGPYHGDELPTIADAQRRLFGHFLGKPYHHDSDHSCRPSVFLEPLQELKANQGILGEGIGGRVAEGPFKKRPS